MCALALDYPGYGFETHKGYAVPEHREALDRLGPSVHHRQFFAPVIAARLKHFPRRSNANPTYFGGGNKCIRVSVPFETRSLRIFLSETVIAARKNAMVASAAGALYQTYFRAGGSARAFRTFHALHLARCRTDPRPAAAGGLARGARLQAGLWLILPVLLYRSPPAISRPCWRSAGNTRSEPIWVRRSRPGLPISHSARSATTCSASICWRRPVPSSPFDLYHLARAIVGAQQAVLAVLLTMTVVALSAPGAEFGPLMLARPLWALLLLHSWQLIGQNRRNAWFAWSIEAGLLLLTTSAAIGLLLLLAGFAVARPPGTAHADVVRPALCAARDRRPGLALCNLAASRRCARHAVLAGVVGSRRAHAAMGYAAGGPRAGDVRHRGAGGPQLCLVRPQRRRRAHHLSSAGRSAGARIRLFLRHRSGAARKPLVGGLFNLDRVVGGAGVALS